MVNRNNLKDKLLFFLHTTFTISKGDVGASHYFYDHLKLLTNSMLSSPLNMLSTIEILSVEVPQSKM